MNQNHKILTIVSVTLLIYWFTTKIVDIYALHPVFGAIYELTALLALIATYITPIVVFIIMFKSEIINRSKYITPLVISILTILVMLFFPILFNVAQ